MTDQEKELRLRVSMLMDADLEGRDNPRLLDRLEGDAELRATWARYHAIGDVLRSAGAPLAGPDFAAKVAAAVAEEPTVLAPKSLDRALTVRPSIVLVGKSMNDHAEVFQAASLGQPAAALERVAAAAPGAADSQADSQFNDYLVMHSETAYMAGSAGMLPYVRLVGSRPGR